MVQDFSTRLAKIRKHRKLTQEQLEELSGVSRCQISLYERSDRLPTLQSAIALADALDVSLDWLAGHSHALWSWAQRWESPTANHSRHSMA